MRPLRVLVVGPAPAGASSRGGMATAATLLASHPDEKFSITVVPTFVDGSRWQRLTVGISGMLSAAWLLLRGRADVLHVNLAHRGSVVRKSLPLFAARLSGTPSVVHAHSSNFADWFDRLPLIGQRLVRAALRADHWLVLGTRHVDEYAVRLAISDDRISVLHNAVRVPPTAVEQMGGDPVHAVSLGRLGERKGSYDLIAAVEALAPSVRRRLRVTLAGDGEVDKVTAAVARAGVADTVRVAGWLDPRQRDQLLSRAHIFVLASRDEGMPMALLEAMAQGLAPLTTPVGSIGEVVCDGVDGLLVSPGNSDELVAGLTRLVTDERLRNRIGAAARARAGGLGLDGWYADLAKLWNRLASTKRWARTRNC